MRNDNINIGGSMLDLGLPVVMGIVNVTPDSFYAGCRAMENDALRGRVAEVVAQGASIVDIGGYSSRPGADDVSPEEELRRVSAAAELVRELAPDVVISVDTFRAAVVRGVAERFGAFIVNDISAGELDAQMVPTVAELGLPYIAMHMRGTPADMQSHAAYADIVSEVADYLRRRLDELHRAGVRDVILDPGFGFAKTTEQNYALLAGLDTIVGLGAPVLAGLSRKSMIYKVLGGEPSGALAGTVALQWECLRKGARILRSHDVREAADTINIFNYYRRDNGGK